LSESSDYVSNGSFGGFNPPDEWSEKLKARLIYCRLFVLVLFIDSCRSAGAAAGPAGDRLLRSLSVTPQHWDRTHPVESSSHVSSIWWYYAINQCCS